MRSQTQLCGKGSINDWGRDGIVTIHACPHNYLDNAGAISLWVLRRALCGLKPSTRSKWSQIISVDIEKS